jgi:outer membrane receptor protein involved in Fe transport
VLRPLLLPAVLLAALSAVAQPTVELPAFAVGASRTGRAPGEGIGAGRLFDHAALAGAAALDTGLRRDPAFGLFRRSDSLTANPTAQGVSLRGVGPSGASRSLVLLDGVPLNDPFGGWVAWNAVPVLALAGAEIRPGGGSAAWGSAALGGVVALVTAPIAGPAGGRAQLAAGERGQRQAEFAWQQSTGPWRIAADGRAIATDGHFALHPSDRGAVDRPLDLRAQAGQVRLGRQVGAAAWELGLRHFEEERGNGTAAQGNASRASTATLSAGGRRDTVDWRLVAYGQSQTFSSRFTTVAPDRSTETPANDQFDVPTTAWGGSLTLATEVGPHRLVAGADVRRVRGETREDFLFTAGTLARRRHAGGTQRTRGACVGAESPLTPSLRLLLQARADAWSSTDGHRREVVRADGSVVRDELFPARDGRIANGTAELRWQGASDGPIVRLAAYSAHRLPTLNELHRPFRVGNITTEANPLLRPETLRGAEAGVAWDRGPWRWSATVFRSDLRDAVGNVTLASSGPVVSRQRLNLDRVRVDGWEAAVQRDWGSNVRVALAALGSHGRVGRASAQPGLEGRRLAQAPRFTGTGTVAWRWTASTVLSLRGRWSSGQFEDDENRLPLAAAGTVDLGIERALSPRTTLRLELDNALDAEVPVARAPGGPVSYGAPRSARLVLRHDW